METIPQLSEERSSGANSSVKSEDSSPRHESGCSSPPPNCAICLGTCKNKSFTDSCLHQFCFKCLLTWSKVKAECPLCKQNFKSIIHNVRSNHQYEEYMVEQRHTEERPADSVLDPVAAPRFRYRTTLTLPRRETRMAVQQLLLRFPQLMSELGVEPPPRRRRDPAAFRRTVYRHNLWARPLPDFTGRFRDCEPDFYRFHESQMHRLVPWLNRELHYLLNENVGHVSYAISRILELLPMYPINSFEFREAMRPYLGERTEHFLHELYCFASTPYDMTGYDRNVQYTTDTRISTMVNEVISSTDTENSVDSDIVMVTSSTSAVAPPNVSRLAGPSRPTLPIYPQNYITRPNPPSQIPIETISHSDSDDESEVMVVGYIKPPQDRTPEVVDLVGSDSDVILQDNNQTEPPTTSENEPHSSTNMVKVSLKRQTQYQVDSDSDSDRTYAPPPPPNRKRRRSSRTSTTASECATTPSSKATWDSTSVASTSSKSWPSADEYSSTDSSYTSKRLSRKKVKRKDRKRAGSGKKASYKKDDRKKRDRKRSSKSKSSKTSGHSKSSKRRRSPDDIANVYNTQSNEAAADQPGTSGLSNYQGHADETASYTQTEGRKLKSVVNVVNNVQRLYGESSSGVENNASNMTDYLSTVKSILDMCTERNENSETSELPYKQKSKQNTGDSSDSEDNLPLNLTVKKSYTTL